MVAKSWHIPWGIRGLCIPLLAVALVLPSIAGAQSDDERARFHFQAGRSYFEQGRYEDSIREWDESYRLSGRAILLTNMAEAQARVFRFDDAIASLERYLREGGAEAEGNRTTIESRIASLRELGEQLRQRTGDAPPTDPPPADPPPTDTPPTDTPPTDTPPTDTPPTDPPPTEVGATDPPPDDPPAEEPGGRRRLWTWVSLGGTGLLAAGAVITGSLAMGARNDLDCPNDICPAGSQSDIDSGNGLALMTDIFIGLAAAAAVTTVLLFIFEGRDSGQGDATATAALAPWFGRDGGGLAAHLRF